MMSLPQTFSRSRRLISSGVLGALLILVCVGCFEEDDTLDRDFEIPRTEAFATKLSAYELYEGDMAKLTPARGVYLYEIPSTLFTDYAKKQ